MRPRLVPPTRLARLALPAHSALVALVAGCVGALSLAACSRSEVEAEAKASPAISPPISPAIARPSADPSPSASPSAATAPALERARAANDPGAPRDEDHGARAAARVRYPYGPIHSPMSEAVVRRLKAVLASSKGRPGVVAKVGDSLTVNSYFLGCFAGSDVRLGDHADLETARAFFSATPADPKHSSFDRTTLAARVCWSSSAVVAGSPCPLEQEITAIEPGFAVVLIGTNDTFPSGPERLDAKLRTIVDIALRRGVIPILTTLPQRRDTTEAKLLVPEMNAVIRATAQAKSVPLIDLFTALAGLPRSGLGKDGIHLATYMNGTARGCWFDDKSLEKGINTRNLVTLQALDRARRFLIESEPPEADPAPLAGEGSWDRPYEIGSLPFVDDGDLAGRGAGERAEYDCGPLQSERRGPEAVYRLTLDEKTHLRARVLRAEGADVSIHLIEDPGRSGRCVQRAGRLIDAIVAPGVYWIAVDSGPRAAPAAPFDYRLTVVRSPA